VLGAVGAAVLVTGVGVGAVGVTGAAVLLSTTGVGVGIGAVGVTGAAVGVMTGVATGVPAATGPTVLGCRGPGVCLECGAAAWCGAG